MDDDRQVQARINMMLEDRVARGGVLVGEGFNEYSEFMKKQVGLFIGNPAGRKKAWEHYKKHGKMPAKLPAKKKAVAKRSGSKVGRKTQRRKDPSCKIYAKNNPSYWKRSPGSKGKKCIPYAKHKRIYARQQAKKAGSKKAPAKRTMKRKTSMKGKHGLTKAETRSLSKEQLRLKYNKLAKLYHGGMMAGGCDMMPMEEYDSYSEEY